MARFLIMGAGAVGGYYGARLTEAGHQVELVARGPHLDAIRTRGLTLESVQGTRTHTLAASDAVGDLTSHPDYIFFAVKSFDTDGGIEQLRGIIGPETLILGIQNGIENHDKLVEAFGAKRVLRGYCRMNAEVVEPGSIRQTRFAELVFGEDDGRSTSRVEALKTLLDKAGIDYLVPTDIRRAVWVKFTWNAVHNVLTGLLHKTVIDLYRDEQLVALMHRMGEELLTVAHAEGIDLKKSDVEDVIAEGRKLGAFRTSTYQDRERGRRLEWDAFTGAVVRAGRRNGVPTPVYDTLDALYRGLDM